MGSGRGLDWRPIEPADARQWAELMSAIQVADRDWEFFSEQDLLEDFDDPHRDFARGSVAVFDGAAMAGYGTIIGRTAAGEVHNMRYDGGVHPDYRGRGLGGRLLDWAEAAALPMHRERFPGRPLSLSGSCISHNAAAVDLYAAHGYHQVRWFRAMVHGLSAAVPQARVPSGVDIVGFTPERSADALLVRNEAFRDHWGTTEASAEGWAHFTGLSAFRPALSSLAYSGGEPLGIVLCQEFDAWAAATGIRDLYIALVGTRRAGRRRGIATALLARTLAQARAAGFDTASLGVDADSLTGALGLYERAGFTVRHTSITQTKPLPGASAGSG